jgi:hypothetical protein
VSADHEELRRLLGGYLLGGLDETDTDQLDAHLRDCDECRDELERLSPVPELLRRVPDVQRSPASGVGAGVGAGPLISMSARPSAENIAGLLKRMRAERRRDRRTAGIRWLAAAAVVLVAAAIGFSVIRTSRETTPPQVLPSPQLVNAPFEAAEGSGLTGQAVLTGKVWGVSVSLDVTKLRGSGPFRCEVHSQEGKVEQAAIWGPTPSGSAKVIGASSFQLRDVQSVSVADHDGHLLGTANVD